MKCRCKTCGGKLAVVETVHYTRWTGIRTNGGYDPLDSSENIKTEDDDGWIRVECLSDFGHETGWQYSPKTEKIEEADATE